MKRGHSLDRLFHARSVALVGISADPNKLTGAPLRNLLKSGFDGEIYLVNPNRERIGDLRCYKSVDQLPAAPDVALVMVASAEVPATIRSLGIIGTRAAIVLSSGFEESGDGADLAAELASAANEFGMAVIGPNCEGLWSVRDRLILTLGSAANREVFHHAPVAIISQSGAIAGAVGRHLQDSGFGCSYIVSVGNETVYDALDILSWVIEQDDVKVVLLFIEALKNGHRFLNVAARAKERGIRIVALKSGNSQLGMMATSSHTGKIATSHAIYRDVFEQAGIIQVDGLVELIEAAEILTYSLPPRKVASEDGGVAVFSIPGGTRALTADLCDRYDLPLARFAPATEKKMSDILPGFAQVSNPTDLTGQVLTRPELFGQSLALVANDPSCEALIVQLANRGPRDLHEKRDSIVAASAECGIPLVVSFLGDQLPVEQRLELIRDGIVPAREPSDAVRYLSWLYKAHETPPAPDASSPEEAASALVPKRWPELMSFLGRAGIEVPPGVVVRSQNDMATASALTFPLVAKVLPDQADHKTELSLVELDIGSAEELAGAISRIRERVGDPDSPVLVQEMVAGIEVVLSVIDDADFGLLLSIGSGGTNIELWRDVGFVAFPVTEQAVGRLIERLRLSVFLEGYRGRPGGDRDALIAAAINLAKVAQGLRDAVSEIEINPLFVRPPGCGVVAADILVREKGEEQAR